MSLINEALRRARETQQRQPLPTPAGPPLQPVERTPARFSALGLPLTFGIVFAAAALLLWEWVQQDRRGARVAARPPLHAWPAAPEQAAATPPLASSLAQPASAPAPAALITAPVPATQPVGQPAASPAVAATPGPPLPVAAPPPAPAATADSAPPGPEPASKPPLKLQGVIAHPTRPSALISGKLLFKGDRIEEFRVVAIEPRSVTLVGAGRTNVLTLD